MPTNATVEQLQTGTGEAWSHPHSSNLITPADGFMTSTAWANWSQEGTPTTPAVLATAEKIYNWGYKYTNDAANEGYYFDVTVSAGDDWAIRAVAHSDGTSVPKCILYDQTNGAEIGSLTGSTASTRAAPDVFIFTGEAPAGCTTLRVKCISTAASGITYWHQVELLANLITNPSMATGAGNPWIPTGWTNQELDAGDSEQETTVIHSGSDSLQYNTGASDEGVTQSNIWPGAGNFCAYGFFAYSDGGNLSLSTLAGRALPHYTASTPNAITVSPSAAWGFYPSVWRQDTATEGVYIKALSGASDVRYVDDVYLFTLDAVSITATAASEANSSESNGVRVDGLDTLTQTITGLGATSGKIRFKWRPRHDAADMLKFNSGTPFIFKVWKTSDSNRIQIYATGTNEITFLLTIGGANSSDTWSTAGQIISDTEYLVEVEYSASQITLSIDGVVKSTITTAIDFGANIPDELFCGANNNGTTQSDAVFVSP